MMTDRRRGTLSPPAAPCSLTADPTAAWATPNGRGVLAGCPTCSALSHDRLTRADLAAVRRGRCGHLYVVRAA